MHDAGLDPWLMTVRQTPPPSDWSSDAGLPWDQVVARHMALLDQNAAIKAAYEARRTRSTATACRWRRRRTWAA